MPRNRQIRAVVVIAAVLAAGLASCSGSDSVLDGRPFEVHEPPDYDGKKPVPLLVVLHGYGFKGEVQSLYFGLDRVTDPRGMLYVAPDGTENPEGKPFWNATAACCGPAGSKVDDSAYLAAVIDKIRADYNVDDRRIFVLGHSNGGFMAYRMACDHADVIAGIASLEGAATADPSECSPSKPVSAVEIHGTADKVISYEGGRNDGTNPDAPPYPGAEQSVGLWAKLDGCDATPVTPSTPTRDLEKAKPPATVTAFGGCKDGATVELWTQPDGSHVPELGDTFTEQVVDFLLAHPKP